MNVEIYGRTVFIGISLSNQREQEDQNKLVEGIYYGDFSPVDQFCHAPVITLEFPHFYYLPWW